MKREKLEEISEIQVALCARPECFRGSLAFSLQPIHHSNNLIRHQIPSTEVTRKSSINNKPEQTQPMENHPQDGVLQKSKNKKDGNQMKKKMRKRSIVFAGALCGTVALFGTMATGQEMSKEAPETDGERVAFSDKPEFLVLPRKGEVTSVECAVYPPRCSDSGTNAGMVLHLYGRGGSCRAYNMMSPPYAKVRRLFWERGYWLVIPDLGADHWMNDTACKSLDAIIEGMIRDRGVDPSRVHILGTSMGGGSGLVYVMRHPGRIRSICAVFPMTDFPKWVEEKPSYLQGIAQAHGVKPSEAASVLQDLSPLYHAASFAGIPVFLLHGDTDSVVPVHHSREFAAALKEQGSPFTYHEAHGLGHDDAIAEPFQREIVEFLTDTTGQTDLNGHGTNKPFKSNN